MSTELTIIATSALTTAMVVLADFITAAIKEEKTDQQQTVTPIHNIIVNRPKGFMDYKTGRFVDIDENGKEYFVD